MRKRKNITEDDVQRWLAKGFGQGNGPTYKPFFHVRDVPSRGRSAIVSGLKTGRIHHYLSDLEYACHLLAEYAQETIEIREQFALLSRDETQQIAKALGFRHPIYPGTKTPIVMTSDLVVTANKDGKVSHGVISVKPSYSIDPENRRARRTIEKLLIEKNFWDLRGVPWCLVTELDIPIIRVRNLDLLKTSLHAVELDCLNTYIDDFLVIFNKHWLVDRPLNSILDKVAETIGLSRQECFFIFARAVWFRLLDVDIDLELIHHHQPLRRIALEGGKHC